LNFILLTKDPGAILGPISNILGYVMDALFQFTSMFGVMNIGVCIILFTLVVKLLMFPLTLKQQKSTKLMAVIQPEINAIQKKYKGKTDNDSMMKMNAETKAVYEKYGTSMTGGCLPLLIQMPILFALYRVIYNIPAYVLPVKESFMNVVHALTGSGGTELAAGAGDALRQFAVDSGVSLSGVVNVGDLTGISGEALANKMVDILYKLNPAQWDQLQQTFPSAAAVIGENYIKIESMNSFLGINLASNPWQGMTPNAAWLIPILAGLTQWFSTKLMSSNQNTAADDENPTSQMMKQMNVTMPLMSVFFCFTFPAAVGLYWVAGAVFQIIQQLAVNSYMNKIDIDDLVAKNVEKANKKRAKKGLPPTRITQNASASLKQAEVKAEKEEIARSEKVEKAKEQIKESSEYYQSDAKPGSLAAKANMVAKFNEKNNKK